MAKTKEKKDKEKSKPKPKSKEKVEKEKGENEETQAPEDKPKKGKDKDKGMTARGSASKTPRGGSKDLEMPPLSSEEKFGPCQVDFQMAKTAIILLQSPESQVVLGSLNCLQKFCKKGDENKKLFIEMDGLIEARKLIFNENVAIQRFAMKLIAITSSLHAAAIQLRDLDTAPDFIRLAALEDPVVVEYATCALSNLAMLYTGRLQIIQNSGIPILVHHLSNPDPDIQKNSAEAIWRILEEPMNLDLLSTKTFIEPIVKLVESEYPALQVVAISILEKIASRDSGVQVLEEIGAIQPLGEKLALPEYGDLHRVILRALTNMCLRESARQKVVPLVPVITRVLDTSPDITAQVHALGLLGILSSVPEVANGLVDYGFCKRLIKIIAGEFDTDMKEAAAYCVSVLSQMSFSAKQEFIDALEPLLALAENETKKLSDAGFEYTMMAFASILEDGHKGCPTFVNKGGLCVFKRLLENREKYSEDGILSLLTCISLVAGHWNLRSYCIDADIIPVILNAMKDNKNPQFLTSCATTFYGLLCNENGRKQFLENDGYNAMVELISHTEFPVVISAVPMLHILGTYQNITQSLIEKGILQVIWKRQDLITKNGPLRTAFERLISAYLPAKYAISGHIDPYEKLINGFYDIGGLKSTDCFLPVNQMNWENKDLGRQVLYLNWDGTINDEDTLNNNQSLQVMKQEGQNCQSLVDAVKTHLSKIQSEKELVRLIATAVSDKMGGVLDKWRISTHTEDIEVADLQLKYKSVVIPISMITNGGFRTRTLLFKALCDLFGIPCSVERGGYKRMWNVILLQSKRLQKPLCPCSENKETAKTLVYTEKLRRFVVDLIYQPGSLLPVNSYDANTYCFV